MKSTKQVKAKIEDYQRFIATLLIFGSYLYIGAINEIYIHPSHDGKIYLILSFTSILVSIILFERQYKLQKKLKK